MLQYAITDRHMFSGDEPGKLDAVIAQARRLAIRGIDVLQLRERDLPDPALESLLRRIVEQRNHLPASTLKILVNGPAHIAAAAGADGVHLRSGAGARELDSVRQTFQIAGLEAPLVSLSCHSVREIQGTALAGFDYLLFGPVFEKRVRGEIVAPGLGLDRLREAAQAAGGSRVIALGGVTEHNAPLCLRAGATGIAGIRRFV